MRAGRVILFFLSIAIGVGAGLAYGWVFNPPPYRDLEPASLRADFRADAVLMVAEIYQADGRLPQALRRLSILAPDRPPALLVAEALLTARELEYAPPDLEALSNLARAVQPTGGEVVPTLQETTATPEITP